jgi:hypothetical protein
MKTIKMIGYALAPALLALCAASSQAAAQLSPARTMAQSQAEVDAAFARDRPLVEGFLAALGTAAPSSWQPGSYFWYSGNSGQWETVTRARFAELISPCGIGEVGGQITLTSGGLTGRPSLSYNGVSVQWACAGAGAVDPKLIGLFDFEHGGGDVWLRPDPLPRPR